jgi:hypothetical protein
MGSSLGLKKSRPKVLRLGHVTRLLHALRKSPCKCSTKNFIKIILPMEVLHRKFHRFADYHLHVWYYRVRFLVASSSLEEVPNARGKLQTDLGLLRPLS